MEASASVVVLTAPLRFAPVAQPGTPGTQPGRRGHAGGKPAPRHRPKGPQYPRPPADPVDQSFNTATQWGKQRAAIWTRWAELVAEPPSDEHLHWRDAYKAKLWRGETPDHELEAFCAPPPRDSERAWPPDGAIHDGLLGAVLTSLWPPPEDYVGGWDPRRTIRELAETGLAEVQAFRMAKPGAADAIAGPLAMYERLLCEARDHPETRMRKSPALAAV
jgi:hypothetical protein